VGVDRQEEADHERVVRWNIVAMTEKNTEGAEKLRSELAKEWAELDAECTEDGVEQEATWCQEAMSSVLKAMAKKIRICARSKRWWNADIKEKRWTVGSERREKMALGGGCQGEGRAPEVNKLVQEKDVAQLPLEHQGSRSVESGAIYKLPSGHDRGGLTIERWKPSKHLIGEGGDAEAKILCTDRRRPVLGTTSRLKRTHTRH
jgi:hypothetical protein